MGFTNSLKLNPEFFNLKNRFIRADTNMKLEYWPPEQFDHKTNHKIDIWSVGILVYLLITGVYPFGIDYVDYEIQIKNSPINYDMLK